MLAVPRGKKFPANTFEILEGTTFLGELSFSRNYNIETVVLPDSYVLEYVPLYDPAYIVFEDTGNLNAGLNLNIAIYCYTGIKAYDVKDSNPNYKSIDGILYTKDGSALVAVPTRYEGFLKIPEGVTLWESAAMWNASDNVDSLMKNCTGVSIPATMTEIAEDQIEKLNRLEKRYSGFQISVSDENPVYYIGKSGQLLKKSNMKDLQVSLEQNTFTFDGQPKEPTATVLCNGETLKAGKDYTVSYSDNINAGTGWIRITGQGNYYGTVEHSFTIQPAQPPYTIPSELSAIYGQTLGEVPLPEGFGWEQPDLPVGDVGNHTFEASYTTNDLNYITLHNIPVTVCVTPKKLDAQNIAIAPWYPWTGRVITPSVTVIDASGEVPAESYTVSFENNASFGKGRATLQDAPGGNYEISGTVEFYIVPGPFLCIVFLMLVWSMTTGIALKRSKKTALSGKPQKNR